MPSQILHLSDIQKRPGVLAAWERTRNRKVHWFVECFAESLGVFFYVYAGIGSTAGWVVGNIIKQPLSSLLQIGFAYALGIYMALAVCAGTSGGHFNPCVTIAFTLFRGFPPMKALRYIVFQIFGAYVACALIYVQWKELIDVAEEALAASGTLEAVQFTPNGPPGIFALYLLPGQTLGRVFLNEWVSCVFIALVIWATLDPTNALVPPSMGPVLVSLSYAVVIWGYATTGVALNTARDLGARLFAMSVWGTAASGGTYAAIATLTNIPATLFGIYIYEIFLTDSDRVVTTASKDFIEVMTNHARLPHPMPAMDHTGSQDNGKATISELEHSHA